MLDYEQIGKQVKIARIQAGVTQEYLAEKVKISTTHLSNVERGTTKVGLNVIVDISKALNVSLDILLCNEVGTPYQKPILNSVPSQQKWTQKSFKKRNESQYFVNLRNPTAFIPRFA